MSFSFQIKYAPEERQLDKYHKKYKIDSTESCSFCLCPPEKIFVENSRYFLNVSGKSPIKSWIEYFGKIKNFEKIYEIIGKDWHGYRKRLTGLSEFPNF